MRIEISIYNRDVEMDVIVHGKGYFAARDFLELGKGLSEFLSKFNINLVNDDVCISCRYADNGTRRGLTDSETHEICKGYLETKMDRIIVYDAKKEVQVAVENKTFFTVERNGNNYKQEMAVHLAGYVPDLDRATISYYGSNIRVPGRRKLIKRYHRFKRESEVEGGMIKKAA